MNDRALLHGCVIVVVAWAAASSARATSGVLVLHSKGAQIDEAVTALKLELGAVDDFIVDDATAVDAVRARAKGASLVIGVGARAATLALKQDAAPVVHCMVLQDPHAFDSERSAGVPLALSARTQLEALRRVVPGKKRVGVLYDPKLNDWFIDEATDAAKALGMTLVARAVATPQAAPAAFDGLVNDVDVLLVVPDATVVSKEVVQFLVARAFDKHLPLIGYSESLVKIGFLAAVAPSYRTNGTQCAKLARRVLAGEAPAKLHGESAMGGALVVNLSTAQRLGVTIPPAVLAPPTQVIGQ